MPIILDHQLREQIPHKATEFPVTYFHDELAEFPNWAAPFHWHPDFEIATAVSGVLDYQVGQQHVTLEAGDSILVNGNMLPPGQTGIWRPARSDPHYHLFRCRRSA